MATPADARDLWRLWTAGELQAYNGQWIAFRSNAVLGSGSDFTDLSAQFASDIASEKGPLFAFIDLEIIQ
jgi:hypothetical protein